MLFRLRRRAHQQTIERLYGAIVAQARQRDFYAALAVPDTVEGRFDLIVLHVHLLFRRLAAEGRDAKALGQHVFDRFIEDMDDSLREMGTGDLAVPKRVRVMGQAFYGRAAAYDAALAESGDDVLAATLLRNVYSGDAAVSARELAHYVRRVVAELAKQDVAEIEQGRIRFPAPLEV
jgi:cytochrome b pre-mRNA-processing protein 3